MRISKAVLIRILDQFSLIANEAVVSSRAWLILDVHAEVMQAGVVQPPVDLVLFEIRSSTTLLSGSPPSAPNISINCGNGSVGANSRLSGTVLTSPKGSGKLEEGTVFQDESTAAS